MKREDVRTVEELMIFAKENPPDENAWIPFSTWSENAVKEVEEMMAERMRADPTRKSNEQIVQALPFNGGIKIYHHRQSRLLAVM